MWIGVATEADGTDGAKEDAAWTFANLATRNQESVLQSIADAHAVPLLVKLLADGTNKGKEGAVRALNYLSFHSEAFKQSITEADAIPLLKTLLVDGAVFSKQYAARALQNLS